MDRIEAAEREVNALHYLEETRARETLKRLRTDNPSTMDGAERAAWAAASAALTPAVGRAYARLREARVAVIKAELAER